MTEDIQGNKQPSPGQVNLLVAMLIRYPQLGNVHYLADEDRVKLVFFLKELNNPQWVAFQKTFGLHMEAYRKLSSCPLVYCQLSQERLTEMVIVQIERDLVSLRREELNIIIGLLDEHFSDTLIRDAHELDEEELEYQDELLDTLFATKPKWTKDSLIGFRDMGKVLVFTHQAPDQDRLGI